MVNSDRFACISDNRAQALLRHKSFAASVADGLNPPFL
jgi:hypothetical protein